MIEGLERANLLILFTCNRQLLLFSKKKLTGTLVEFKT